MEPMTAEQFLEGKTLKECFLTKKADGEACFRAAEKMQEMARERGITITDGLTGLMLRLGWMVVLAGGESPTKVQVDIEPDEDAENPADEGGWKPYSFSSRHRAYQHPTKLGLSTELGEDGLPVVEDDELKQKLEDGRAFLLSYFEHGSCQWSLLDQGPKCRFDSVRIGGLLVWEGDENDLGKTRDERAKSAEAFLGVYTQWCNGQVYGYSITDPTEAIQEAGCWGFFDMDQMFREIKDIVGDREVSFGGRLGELAQYHWPPKPVPGSSAGGAEHAATHQDSGPDYVTLDGNTIKAGMRVQVVNMIPLGSGTLINDRHISVRRENAIGKVIGYVAGHGGDVWWVQHEDNPQEVGAYFPGELAEIG